MKTLIAPAISFYLIAFAVGGCYTQVRSPVAREDAGLQQESSFPAEMPAVSAQRFEYYNHYGRNEIWDPYDYRSLNSYHPYSTCLQWPYTYRPNWYSYQMAWAQACWISVYHPVWRRYPPRVLVPYVVYRSGVVAGENEAAVVVRQRPQRRQAGFEGAAPSAQAIRTNHVNTPSVTQSQPGSGTSSKQTADKKEEGKKKKEKEEKREEKRDDRKKRGGMR